MTHYSSYDSFYKEGYDEFVGTWVMKEVSAEGSYDTREPARTPYEITFSDDMTADYTGGEGLGENYKLSVYYEDDMTYVSGSDPDIYSDQQFSAYILDGELAVTLNQITYHDDGSFDAMSWRGYFERK